MKKKIHKYKHGFLAGVDLLDFNLESTNLTYNILINLIREAYNKGGEEEKARVLESLKLLYGN